MNRETKKNVAASIRQRLLNISKDSGENFNLILIRYGLERMLYRLGQSEWRNQFLLKGAMLFTLWHDKPHRPTRDADFLGFIDPDLETIKEIFQSLCEFNFSEDGILFDPESVHVEEIRENNIYEGIRVRLRGKLANAIIHLQFDIGFGDAVTPDPENIIYPTLLNHKPPELKAYPVYTVIAEKFEAMIKLGMFNSRMKDFYDLWVLINRSALEGKILANAIKATFKRRKTEMPTAIPLALTREFYDNESKRTQWSVFLRKNGIKNDLDLQEIMRSLESFLIPPVAAINAEKQYDQIWKPSTGWNLE